MALADAGAYDCVVTNPAGTVTSDAAAVTINGPPAITRQPASIEVVEGEPLELGVEATGASLSYQWHKNGVAIAGATSASFGIAEAMSDDAGEYRVVVTNPAGNATSDTVMVVVSAASDGGGCGCNGGAPTGGGLVFAAVLLGLLVRRRR